MGSNTDLDVMSAAAKTLDEFNVPYEVRIISAHRTPAAMSEYARGAKDRGIKVIIAGAGGSAHLPGMTASETTLPVIAIPVSRSGGHEALWSNIKMPPGIPLATMPENGADRGALLAIRILALNDESLAQSYAAFVREQTEQVVSLDRKMQNEGWQAMLD